ncbi:LCP family protein [Microbacterium sp.]|uniref:LCP family protein n=1 Tax=Microbacterium sp. TaxID=51671 RepID=UPI003A8D77A5
MRTPGRRQELVARHARLRTPTAAGQLLKLIGIAVAVVLVSGIAVGVVLIGGLFTTVASNSVEIDGGKELPPDIAAYKGGFDILLTGVDTCEPKYAALFGQRCEGPDTDGINNDVTLLMHVSAGPRRVTVISFPRDMMMAIPACTDADGKTHSALRKAMLNVAYAHGGDKGGLNCVAKTVSSLLGGEDIEFAAKVTFGGVIEITNAIGGVDVCLATPIIDRETGLNLSAGHHTVEGLQALQFLRTRHGVGDGSDLGRIGNQQQYMSSLVRKLMSSQVLGNVGTVMKLADIGLSNVEASTSLADPVKIAQIALALKDVPVSDFTFVQYPVLDDPENANRVVPDEQNAAILWDAITANKQLQITHQNTKYDGVVVKEPAPGTSTAPTPDPSATPGGVVDLPSSIKGTSAAVQTCSNGQTYR